jgi:hypothetical protein
MIKQHAESLRLKAVEAIAATQSKLGRAVGAERERLKAELAQRCAELVEAKATLRKINLALAGAQPIEPPPPPAKPSVEELARQLVESFEQLLIADPSHPAIRTLRTHFLEERGRQPLEQPKLRLPPPTPLRTHQRIPYLDAGGRRVTGPGTLLYRNGN